MPPAPRGESSRQRFSRRTPIAAFLGAIADVELVAIDRGLGAIAPELADATAWLLFDKGLYDLERAPLPNEASEGERRGYFEAIGAELGDGELAVAILGRGEPLDFATVRPSAPFADWAPALLVRPSPTSAFVFSGARDVAVLLQRRSADVVARVAHGVSARLVAAVGRDRAAKAERAAEEVARVRARLTTFAGVEVSDAPADLPSPETLAGATPWDESSPERRPWSRGEPGTWLVDRLASLATDEVCFVWTRAMRRAWLTVRPPSSAAWLVELCSGAKEVIVLSSDRARALVLRADEHEDVACLVPVAVLLDRAASLAALDARLAENDGLRLAAPSGPRDVDPALVCAPSHRRRDASLTDASEAATHLAALVAELDMAERLPEAVKREGAVGTYALSMGHEAPLAFRTVFTFDAGRWLVDLWQPDLDRLFVARPDDAAVLAFLRVDGAAEVFLGPRSSS